VDDGKQGSRLYWGTLRAEEAILRYVEAIVVRRFPPGFFMIDEGWFESL
jgi:hypothetical protein